MLANSHKYINNKWEKESVQTGLHNLCILSPYSKSAACSRRPLCHIGRRQSEYKWAVVRIGEYHSTSHTAMNTLECKRRTDNVVMNAVGILKTKHKLFSAS